MPLNYARHSKRLLCIMLPTSDIRIPPSACNLQLEPTRNFSATAENILKDPPNSNVLVLETYWLHLVSALSISISAKKIAFYLVQKLRVSTISQPSRKGGYELLSPRETRETLTTPNGGLDPGLSASRLACSAA